jgi:hypothetical protein
MLPVYQKGSSAIGALQNADAIERRQYQAQNVSTAAFRLHNFRVNRGAT